jgi:putative tricarboxylic transport membrane protein
MDFAPFLNGFGLILEFKFLLYMVSGVTLGVVVGALPGLTGSLGLALMLPFTYTMDPLSALVFLLAIYSGGLFGGGITSILINTPGSTANIATLMDGYPMTQKGQADRALGIGLSSSVLGGIIGCIFLAFVMRPLAVVSLKFGPAEMFMVAVFGLTVIGSLSKNITKSLFAGLLGILLGTIGMSNIGTIRGSFGSMFLLDGIPLIPALIGFLALPEMLKLAGKEFVMGDVRKTSARGIIAGFRDTLAHPITAIRSAIIGVVVGVMPAAGATVASILSYNQAKQWSDEPERYGTGIPEGIIAGETANNASQGGAMATMLVLGIPASANTAMLIGALILQGWVPGPSLFREHADIVFASISSLFLNQFVMLGVGIVICTFASKIITLPTKYLVPCLLVFTMLGAFSSRSAVFDVGMMFTFGVLGWLMQMSNFPTMPVVLGIILGPIADKELLRIVQIYSGNYGELLTKPIAVILLVLSLISISLPAILERRRKKRALDRLKE